MKVKVEMFLKSGNKTIFSVDADSLKEVQKIYFKALNGSSISQIAKDSILVIPTQNIDLIEITEEK